MPQYYLAYPNKVMFPKNAKSYALVRNEKGEPEGKIIETPNSIPIGLEPDKWNDTKEYNITLP